MDKSTIFGQAVIEATIEVQTYNEMESKNIITLCDERINKWNIGINHIELLTNNGEIEIPFVHDFKLKFHTAIHKGNGIFEVSCTININISLNSDLVEEIITANITMYDFRRSEYKFNVGAIAINVDNESLRESIEINELKEEFAFGIV